MRARTLKMILIIVGLLFHSYANAQNASYIKGKHFTGYAFPKEYAIMGLPPESNRYTLSRENIIEAEKLLRDSVPHLTNEYGHTYKPHLKNYYHQYVGYITSNNHILVHIYLSRKGEIMYDNEVSKDLILVFDGGDEFWEIVIDVTGKRILGFGQHGFA